MRLAFIKAVASPKLKHFDYMGPWGYAITICCYEKLTHFLNKDAVELALGGLREASTKYHFEIWAYCFMPDHVHFLIMGINFQSDLMKFVSAFKQRTGFTFQKKFQKKLWQSSFFDRVIRKPDTLINEARYIFENPVRSGLVEDYRNYPASGSWVFDWRKMGFRNKGP